MGCRSRLMDDTLRREALETGEREAAFISSSRVRPVYFTDHDYPARLDGCDDAPAMLYAIGDTDLNDCRVVSVVGTRNATPYGLKFVDNLIRDLAQKVENVIIVSGLAYGTDVAAHRQAMAAGLPTVGVLAHGLTTIYPAVHRNVAADMVNHGGMLLTEYRSDAAVHRGNFLARNRIVAGLSDCVVVAESATKGGALVTAKIAAGYDRDVFALPGRVNDEYSAGCNRLIIDNVASMATSADDIINFMGWPMRPQEGQQSGLKLELSAEQLMVVDYLKRKGEAMLNKMSVDLDRPIAKLMALLVDMEFDGLVVNLPGGRYRLP
jgi:DNA processing protein